MARVKVDCEQLRKGKDQKGKDQKGKDRKGKENQITNVETRIYRVAVLGQDWRMGPLPAGLVSGSNGWVCLKKTEKACNIFMRKNQFMLHMKKYHNLVPDFSKVRGRPKLGTRKHPPLSNDPKLRQDDAQSGVYPHCFWSAKRKYMIQLLNSNIRMFEIEDPKPPEGCMVWCKNRSVEQYLYWRHSTKATKTLNSMLQSTATIGLIENRSSILKQLL
jgi:hypothetical protein